METKEKIKTIKEKIQTNMTSEMSEEYKIRIKEEFSFMKKNESLMDDVLYFLENNFLGGDLNEPNSLLFFILGITSKEPDLSREFSFLFEVDAENSRISPPDIDIDFEHREPILKHICDVYGEDRVALIGTAMTYKPKASIQFAAKACNVAGDAKEDDKKFSSENDKIGKEFSKILPNVPKVTLKQFLGEEKYNPPNQRIKDSMRNIQEKAKQYPEVFTFAKKLEGMFKAFGTHAAGVVISANKITKDIPLHVQKIVSEEDDGGFSIEENKLDLMTTQFDMEDIEQIGLLKFDFLQIDTLRQMRLCLNMIEKDKGIKVDIDNLETNDEKVFKTISSGKLEGLFQISGDVFRGKEVPKRDFKTGQFYKDEHGNPIIIKQKGLIEVIGCDSFEDIVAANALGRPGPLISNMHKEYSKNKKNPELTKYDHPLLEKILKPTFSQMIFQEQLTEMSQLLAGFTYKQADKLRSACAKKKTAILKEIKPDFFAGCEKNNIPKETAEKFFSIAEEFGEYAFNKSHCLSEDTFLFEKKSKEWIRVDLLENGMILDSYVSGKSIEDEVVGIVDAGEQDVYEIKFSNGLVVEATLDHKFMCIDKEYRTVKEIVEGDFEVISDVLC